MNVPIIHTIMVIFNTIVGVNRNEIHLALSFIKELFSKWLKERRKRKILS